MSIPAFLSHSHEDRKLASALKLEFSRYGIDIFIAHEDLALTCPRFVYQS